jgi:hypothetical protein
MTLARRSNPELLRALLCSLLAAFVLLGGGICKRREQGFREARDHLRTELARIERLPDDERAQAVWDLWLEFADDRTVPDVIYEEPLAQELAKTGDAGLEVLLEALEGPGPGTQLARAHLWRFGEDAVAPLVAMLEGESEKMQLAALESLWRFVLHGMEAEQMEAVRKAVAPLLEAESPSIREWASIVLEDISTYGSQ